MRIVSLLSSATEILFALGLEEQVLAVSHECDFPPTAKKRPKATRSLVDSSRTSGQIDADVQARMQAGSSLYEVDAALVASLRPDLIVTQAQCDVCAVRYEDVMDLVRGTPTLAAARVLALNPTSLAESLADVERVGVAAGAASAAQDYANSLHQRAGHVQTITGELPSTRRPRVTCLEWLDPLMAAGNWTPELIALAGGESGLATSGRHSGYVQPDDVLRYDPEVLIVAPCGFDRERTIREAQVLTGYSFWGRVAACRAGRVFALDGNAYLNRSGPRILDSLEILAHLLHPDLFPAPACAAAPQPWARLADRGGRIFSE